MTFPDSIKTCFSKYADFNGRASRSEYWWWVLFFLLGSAAAGVVGHIANGLFGLAVLLPSIAVATRRLHDTDRSGWLQLIGIIPLIGLLILLFWTVQEGKEPNRFGEAPNVSD